MAHETYAPMEGLGHVDGATYDRMYRESLDSPDSFWSKLATELLFWQTPPAAESVCK